MSNICHTFLKSILFEVPFYMNAILLYTYILPVFPSDLAILTVSLESYYILLSNILLYFLNLLNCKIFYCNKIFLDLFCDFFLLFHFVSVYVALYIYVLFLILLICFQRLFFIFYKCFPAQSICKFKSIICLYLFYLKWKYFYYFL